jgi:hypothetical protein
MADDYPILGIVATLPAMRRWIYVAAALAAISPAHATGGFGCSAQDANLTFDSSAAVGQGLPTSFLNFQASADIAWKELPADFRKPDMTKALVQSWWLGPNLKMQFYTERQDKEPFASLEIVIETREDGDEGAYEGTYLMKLYENAQPEPRTAEVSGKVHCDTE